MQIQNRASLALPELDNFRSVSKTGNKVKRSRSVNLRRALDFDMTRVGYIKDGQLSAVVLFDVKMRSTVECFVEEHRLACLPR
jgi:hypothetical protein